MAPEPRGYTLVEVLLALLLIAIGVLAAAPMFVFAAKGNSSGGHLELASTLAEERMETLLTDPFDTLTDGGSLDANVAGYSEVPRADFDVRWRITSSAGPDPVKTIEVRAVASPQGSLRRSVTYTTLRCR